MPPNEGESSLETQKKSKNRTATCNMQQSSKSDADVDGDEKVNQMFVVLLNESRREVVSCVASAC